MKTLIESLPGLMMISGGLIVVVESSLAGIRLGTMIFRMAAAMAIALIGGVLVRTILLQKVETFIQRTPESTPGDRLDVTVAESEFEDLKDILSTTPSETDHSEANAEAMSERRAGAVRASSKRED